MFTNATCKGDSLLSRCLPTLKCNVTSKTMASDTFNCELPRCQRATLVRNTSIRLHHVPPCVRAVALQTGGRCHGHRSPFPVGCRSRTVHQTCLISVLKNVKVNNQLGWQKLMSNCGAELEEVYGHKREQPQCRRQLLTPSLHKPTKNFTGIPNDGAQREQHSTSISRLRPRASVRRVRYQS